MKQTLVATHRRIGFEELIRDTPLDKEAIAAALKVDDRAREAAQHNAPASDATEPDHHEQAIVSHHAALLRESKEHCTARQRPIQQRLWRLAEKLDGERLEDIYTQTLQDYQRLKARFQDLLVPARKTERQEDRDLRCFKQKNHLDREPHQPESLALHYAALAFMVIVEGVINSWAFSPGSDYGWIGALQESLLVAGVNVAAAFFAGMAVREVFHVALWRKLLGVVIGALYLGFLAGYALLVTHYRSALAGADPETAVAEAVVRLHHTPLAVEDFWSVLLLLCTLGFALAAFFTGAKSKDRYPGFTEVHRRYQEADGRLIALRHQYWAELDGVFRSRPAAVQALLGEQREAQVAFRATLEDCKQLVKRYVREQDDIAASCRDLIRRYRSINARVRNDEAPGYFSCEPVFAADEDAPDLFQQVIDEAEAVASRFPQQISELQREAGVVKEKLAALYQQALQDGPEFFALTEAIAEGRAVVPAEKAQATADKASRPQAKARDAGARSMVVIN